MLTNFAMTMQKMLRATALALLALTLLSACKSTRQQGATEPAPDTVIRVQNSNVLDMTVYVIRDGQQRIRLGMVTAGHREVFTLPGYVVTGAASLRFVADPIGSTETYLIDELTVFPGDEIDLWIPSYRRR